MINIYGIYRGIECLYIGETTRPYEDRVKEHMSALKRDRHDNKTLQRLYNECDGKGITYRLVDSIDAESSLLRFFYESLWISFLKPVANKCTIVQGTNRVTLQRCEQDKAKQIIDSINGIYNDAVKVEGK